MNPDSLAALAQFGLAGMVGAMWLWERRAAGDRERQLTQAHERMASDRLQLTVLVEALRDNTRALVSLEAGQRDLAACLGRFADAGHAPPARAA